MSPIDDPFDHNAECRFCDEQAMHRADCPWLLQLIAKLETFEIDLARGGEVITNQLRNLGELRRQVEEAARVFEETGREMAAKLQMLVNCMDDRGLLPEHVFTFPDGDTWEAQPPKL